MWPESGLRGVGSPAKSDFFALLLGRSPGSAAAVGATEGSGTAAGSEAAGAGEGHAIALTERADRAARADGTRDALAYDLARGDHDRAGRGAAAADADDHPGAVETPATSTTASRGTARLLGRLAAARRGRRLGGTIRSRAGQRLLVIADRAAGAAGLRDGGRWSDGDGQEEGQANRRDDGIAHEQKSKMKNRINGRSRRHRRNR